MIGLCFLLVMGHDSTLWHSKIAKAIHRILRYLRFARKHEILRGSWESTCCRNRHPHTLPPVPPAKILVALQRWAATPTRPADRATPWLPWPVSSTVTGPSLQRSTSLEGFQWLWRKETREAYSMKDAWESGEAAETTEKVLGPFVKKRRFEFSDTSNPTATKASSWHQTLQLPHAHRPASLCSCLQKLRRWVEPQASDHPKTHVFHKSSIDKIAHVDKKKHWLNVVEASYFGKHIQMLPHKKFLASLPFKVCKVKGISTMSLQPVVTKTGHRSWFHNKQQMCHAQSTPLFFPSSGGWLQDDRFDKLSSYVIT